MFISYCDDLSYLFLKQGKKLAFRSLPLYLFDTDVDLEVMTASSNMIIKGTFQIFIHLANCILFCFVICDFAKTREY